MEDVSILSTADRPGRKALRAALVSSVALAMLAALASSADAARRSRSKDHAHSKHAARGSNPEKDGFSDMPKEGVLQIGISIGSQRATVFRDGKRMAQGPISSGMAGHLTPMGVFSVIEKDRHHRSNIYSAAPMPFMQRITWSGVAMHEGPLPGHPASHGCIRLTHDFAARLWPTTKLGVRVIVSRHEIAPIDFDHPSLFSPKLKPAEPPVAMNDPVDGGKPALLVHVAEAATAVKDAGGIDLTRSALEPAKPVAPAAVAEDTKPAVLVPADDRKPADAVAVVETKPLDDGSAAEKPPAAVAEPAAVVPIASEPKAAEPAAAAPVSSEPKAADAAPPGEGLVKPAPTGADAPKLPAPRYKKAEQPPKRNGQVSVFVSRKEKKIFVRQGFVPLFDMPIVIEDINRPLGTHVFTAMGPRGNGGGMRWNLITVTDPTKPEHREPRRKKNAREQAKPAVVETVPSTTAKEALDRIQMPKEAVDRISELLIPGSSLVISDQGTSYETGRGTEFIILTH